MGREIIYICKSDSKEQANEASIYARIVDENARRGYNLKGYTIERRKKFGEEALEDIFILPEDFKKFYEPASIMDMSLLKDDAFPKKEPQSVDDLLKALEDEEDDYTLLGKSTATDADVAAIDALFAKV